MKEKTRDFLAEIFLLVVGLALVMTTAHVEMLLGFHVAVVYWFIGLGLMLLYCYISARNIEKHG